MKHVFFNSFILFILIVISSSCNQGGKELNSDDLKKEMDQRKPRRIKPYEISEAGLKKGRELVRLLENGDSASIDALAKKHVAIIKKMSLLKDTPGNLHKIEAEILDAYRHGLSDGFAPVENAQVEDTFILYTAPVAKPDSSSIWSIKFSKRFVIMSMTTP